MGSREKGLFAGLYEKHANMGKSSRESFRDASDELPQETIEKAALRRLERMGLEVADLEGKKVLDLGSRTSDIERGLSKYKLDVVSVDIDRESFSKRPEAKNQLQADALNLPFKDESMDVVISMHNAPPGFYEEKDVLKSMDEIVRILSKSGTARITPLELSFINYQDGIKEFFKNGRRYGNLSDKEKHKVEMLRKKRENTSLEYLKSKGYNIYKVTDKVTRPTKKDPTKNKTIDVEYWDLRK